MVLQHIEKVVKPDDEKEFDQRFDDLELEINKLKSLLLLNESETDTKIKNRWAQGDSNARPSPYKGDVFELELPLSSLHTDESLTNSH